MLKIPFEEIILKIEAKTGLPQDEIRKKVDDKLQQLYGLVSKEGAAHIIANELGVKLFEVTGGKVEVKSLLTGMRNVELHGIVKRVYEARAFQKETKQGKVGSFLLGDDTGLVRVVLWNEQADKLSSLNEGNLIVLKGGYVKERNAFKEIHIPESGSLEITGEGVKREQIDYSRKSIKELSETDQTAELLGTIVQVFDLKFFQICSTCGKKAKQTETGYFCEQHGSIKPQNTAVLNLFLDDGTDNVRVVCFRRQLLRILSVTDQELEKFMENPMLFDEKRNELLGSMLKVSGRVVKNTMFDRLEIIASLIYLNPDPTQELERLKDKPQMVTLPDRPSANDEDSEINSEEEFVKDEDVVDE
ncbi:MAG: OB-fold nucleic acid binding domain-containing protein [Nanoarchaeota archaeon]